MYSRGGVADVGGDIEMQKGDTLAGSEGLVLRIMGDNQPYTLLLRTGAATFLPTLQTMSSFQFTGAFDNVAVEL